MEQMSTGSTNPHEEDVEGNNWMNKISDSDQTAFRHNNVEVSYWAFSPTQR